MQKQVSSAWEHVVLLSGGFQWATAPGSVCREGMVPSDATILVTEMLHVLRQTAHLTTDYAKRPGLRDAAYHNGIYDRAERETAGVSNKTCTGPWPHLSKLAKRKKPKRN